MSKYWPFGFFVYSNVGDKEAVGETEVVTEEKPVELVKVVWSETPASVVVEEEPLPVEETVLEEIKEDVEDEACEDEIKAQTGGATSRCIPEEEEHLSDVCVCCGKPAKHMVYWGKAY